MEEEGKKTKGKQKIEIKKIDKANDLSSTFAKRKYGVHKKACELSTLTGARVDILMFSPCGRSFSYGDPSLRLLTRTISDDEHPLEGVNYDQLVEDHKRSKIDELNKKHDALQDQVYVEKAREKELKDILKTRKNDGWWEAKVQGHSCEHAEEMEASLLELHENLSNEPSIKCGGNSSHAPKNQLSENYSNFTHAFENNNLFESIRGEDSFVVVSSPSKKAHGANESHRQGDDLDLSPSNQCQGDDPFLHNTSNENADNSDNHAIITFSPSNQH
ncbi:hypothetical protein SESBI_32592 [Sesbania bispinosa]|nr:hypothetical protein SESBI_32592 [Sesbania bispinosa]